MKPEDVQPEAVLDTDGWSEELARAVEALVFAADEPVTVSQIGDVFAAITQDQRPTQAQVEYAVQTLNASYARNGHALRIHTWAGGYRMATTPDVTPYLKAFFQYDRSRKLTRSLMETLAILAYRQPVTKPEVDFVRGVDSDYAIRRLLDLGLIDVVGRAESVGRPLLYGTTSRFLDEFGLANLDDLPNLREIEELLNDPSFNKERARLLMLKGLDTPQPLEGGDPSGNDEPET
jgi:segregation and condensation protein B